MAKAIDGESTFLDAASPTAKPTYPRLARGLAARDTSITPLAHHTVSHPEKVRALSASIFVTYVHIITRRKDVLEGGEVEACQG